MTIQKEIELLTQAIKDATVAAHKANSNAAAVKYLNSAYRMTLHRNRLQDKLRVG